MTPQEADEEANGLYAPNVPLTVLVLAVLP